MFFSKNLNFLNLFFAEKKTKKNAILLVLPSDEISVQPELSSPPCYRIQGGSSERDARRTNEGRKSSCLILDGTLNVSGDHQARHPALVQEGRR